MRSNNEHTRVSPIVKAIAIPLVIAYAGFMLGMTAVDGHPEVALVIVAGYVSLLFTGIKARIKANTSGSEAGPPNIYNRCLAMLMGFIFWLFAKGGWNLHLGQPNSPSSVISTKVGMWGPYSTWRWRPVVESAGLAPGTPGALPTQRACFAYKVLARMTS